MQRPGALAIPTTPAQRTIEQARFPGDAQLTDVATVTGTWNDASGKPVGPGLSHNEQARDVPAMRG